MLHSFWRCDLWKAGFLIAAVIKSKYRRPLNNMIFNCAGPLIHGFSPHKYLYYFPPVVGSPWIQRTACMNWSTPFLYRGLEHLRILVSVGVGGKKGGYSWNQWIWRDNTSFCHWWTWRNCTPKPPRYSRANCIRQKLV